MFGYMVLKYQVRYLDYAKYGFWKPYEKVFKNYEFIAFNWFFLNLPCRLFKAKLCQDILNYFFQVTDVPEGVPLERVELLQPPEGYNELLYSHLLDGVGTRLTYTHFTAKVTNRRLSNHFRPNKTCLVFTFLNVFHFLLILSFSQFFYVRHRAWFTNILLLQVNWNSMIEICFNRSVKIQANKVYRIGMVLNKVD